MIPALTHFPEGQIIAFALVFLRAIAFVIAMPVIGTGAVPAPVKVLFSLVLALVLFPIMKFTNPDLLVISDQIIFLAARELFVGVFLGYLMRLFFFAISIAGEIIGVSSGAAQAQLFNPAMGTQANVLEQFYLVVATLFFFGFNGHHIFLQGLAKSYDLIPIANVAIKTEGLTTIAMGFQSILTIGIKLASPIMISVLLTNLAMGVLGRAVPQMNVFVTSMQVTFLMTLFILLITVPFFMDEMEVLLNGMAGQFMAALKVL